MSTVIWSGTVARQPSQGEMRRFIVKARVDARSSNMLTADTNKVFLIKAGWFLQNVFARNVVSATTYGTGGFWDSAGVTWGATFGFGGAAGVTGSTGLIGGATALIGSKALAGGKYYSSDDYISMSIGVTFDGCIDVFADVIDTNPREDPGTFSR